MKTLSIILAAAAVSLFCLMVFWPADAQAMSRYKPKILKAMSWEVESMKAAADDLEARIKRNAERLAALEAARQ